MYYYILCYTIMYYYILFLNILYYYSFTIIYYFIHYVLLYTNVYCRIYTHTLYYYIVCRIHWYTFKKKLFKKLLIGGFRPLNLENVSAPLDFKQNWAYKHIFETARGHVHVNRSPLI